MERGLLSSPDLAPHYDDVVWMYLFQDFSHSKNDRAAERVAIRFGISAWPQHVLIDPASLKILGDTGRELKTFARAVAASSQLVVEASPDDKAGSIDALADEDLRGSDQLAAKLQQSKDIALAKAALTHQDQVVRYLAVLALAESEPESIVAAAAKLLQEPHDQTRFLVLKTLATHGNSTFARELDSVLADPEPSMNPNVVRYHAARALAKCGDAASLAMLARFGVGGAPNNNLTATCLDSIAAIGLRNRDVAKRARALLIAAFPEPVATAVVSAAERQPKQDPKHVRRIHAMRLRLAERVHELLGALTSDAKPFPELEPEHYDRAARERLVSMWQ